MNIKGFIWQQGYEGKELMAISHYCCMKQIPCKSIQYSKKSTPTIEDGFIPVGCIEWISRILGKTITPNYYPDFLRPHLNRNIWEADKWPLGEKVFIKPSDKHKRFTGFCTNGRYKGKKKGPYWCSDIIHFDNEWRYYVANGKVMTAEWYHGDEVNTPDAPSIDHIEIPKDYFGAIDFGMYNGKLTLVEANEPFSCGWYGKDHFKYAEWLTLGWINRDKWFGDVSTEGNK